MTDIPEPDDIFRQTLCGIPVIQKWCDLWLWEQVLANSPQIKGVIEIGALYGGLSIFLLMHAIQRAQHFCFIDREDVQTRSPLADRLGLHEHKLLIDLWSDDGMAAVQALLDDDAWHPLLILCDNGNKPREVQTIAPLLRPGDVIAVHDWGTEFGPGDLTPVEHLLEPYLLDLAESIDSMTRWWVKR